MCSVEDAPAGGPCATGVCGGGGTCVECLMDGDCTLPEVCDEPSNLCVPASCSDGELNGDETDLNCGGSCPPCANGLDCLDFGDCASGVCTALSCAPCAVIGDCQGGNWCNVGTCALQQGQGTSCTVADACGNGNCVDNFCCESSCVGTCQACAASLTGTADGVCSFVDTVSDPDAECPGGACQAANCSGTSAACDFATAGSDCGAQTCANGTESQPQCNAGGACNQIVTTSCNGHQCAGASCDSDCQNQDSQCLPTFYCENADPVCQADLAVGDDCLDDSQCPGDFCVDGFCCNMACNGLCESCAAATSIGANGTCSDIMNNTDPDNECPGANNCVMGGTC